MDLELVERAAIYAMVAHKAVGQVRKYTGEPYHKHPQTVAQMVWSVGGDDEMIAAAHLHDVVEDTHITVDDIEQSFGMVVATFVDWLTDHQTLADGNRAFRKQREREKLARAPRQAQTIKLADLINNSHTIAEHDPDFAKVYFQEKRLILEVMRQGDAYLYDRAWAILDRYQQ